MKSTILSRSRIFLAGVILSLAVFLAPSPARAGWSVSVNSPSGYILIGSGGVAIGVAVVIGVIYFRAEARSMASLPSARAGLLDNPSDFKDKGQVFRPRLDLLSYNF